VFKGRDVNTDEIYAIKFLELEKTKGNDIQVIVNEINIMKQSIECPYIVEYALLPVPFLD
jgi:serine/threonine protein kinase